MVRRVLRRRDDAGLAVPLVVASVVVLASLALAAALLGRLLADHRRAAAAADLSALAAAAAIQFGQPPCPAAEGAARRNGARLVSCTVDGARVRVVAVRSSAPVLGRPVEVRVSAHAGPVE